MTIPHCREGQSERRFGGLSVTSAFAINLNRHCPNRVLDPHTREPITFERLAQVLPPSLAEMELTDTPAVPIPDDLRAVYASFRPTPIFSAERFAAAIGGGCQILVKDEGRTPSNNHKMNSALWIAYHCARDGVKTITTETTGNWGLALALACQRFAIELVCFIDRQSVQARPDRVGAMQKAGARVEVVDDQGGYDPLVLSADRAVTWTRRREGAQYVFGSVYNYFILPQTMTGLEAQVELLQDPPDVVVGSCGGGANLLGICAPYLDQLARGEEGADILCAESELCPIVSKGVLGEYSIDRQDFFPRLRTYGLDRLLGDNYIGGLGSTIVATPVAAFHEAGFIRAETFSAQAAANAAALFELNEGRRVALETGYQLAAVVAEAQRNPGRRLLVNISTVADKSYA